jgi:urease accessory protein
MTQCGSRLDLRFDSAGLTVGEQQPPWKVVRSFASADGGCLVHLNNISGGVLAGDRLHLSIRAAAGAHAQVTTTGATRLYRANVGASPARQSVCAEVGAGALLEYLPDPVIPFAGARYEQTAAFQLQPDGGLFWWEILAPGRAGEQFAYERLDFETAIDADGPIAIERARLEPGTHSLHNPVQMASFTHCATFFICRAGLPSEVWANLETVLAQSARMAASPQVIWGVSTLVRDGLVIRGLAMETRHLLTGLLDFRRQARMELYGSEPTALRKTY